MKKRTQLTIAKMLAAVLSVASLTTIVAARSADAASTDCPSGYVCIWTGGFYTGTMKKFSTPGQFLPINLTYVGSYYNNRTLRAGIHEAVDGSARHICVAPGQKAASTTGWVTHADAVYLSSVNYC